MGTPISCKIAETTGPDKKTVVLDKWDVPHGMPREMAGWEQGGELNRNEVYYSGNPRPIYYVHQPREMQRTLKGHFRDHLWGEPGHAYKFRDALLDIWRRGRIVEVTWGGESFTGLLHKPKFGIEGLYDVTYELTFDVAFSGAVQPDKTQRQLTPRANVGPDLWAKLQQIAEDMRARQIALALAATIKSAVRDAWNTLTNKQELLQGALTTAQVVVTGPPSTFISAWNRVSTLAQQVADAGHALEQQVSGLSFETAMSPSAQDVTNEIAFSWSTQETVDYCTGLYEAVRALRGIARQKTKPSGKLYRVKPGDTPESIATATLGSASRVDDLHLSSTDLVPGNVIEVPVS